MTALFLAYVAGALTTINPCVLPLVPILAASALASGPFGPAALGAGLVTSFTAIGVAISASGTFIGLDSFALRGAAAILLMAAGIVLLIPAFEQRLALALAPVGVAGVSIAERAGHYGVAGQFGVGLLAGAIWTPCSGPSLAAAFALAAEPGSVSIAALRMFVFALGAASAVVLLAYGSRRLLERRRAVFGALSRGAKPIAGALFLIAGIAIYTGADKRVESFILDLAPAWLVSLTISV